MMPVVNKPLIEYGVEEANSAGMTGMCIVTGRGKHSLMDHFDKNYELEDQIQVTDKEELLDDIRSIIDAAQFTYIRQREMKGLGHAILTGRELVCDELFAVVLTDALLKQAQQDCVIAYKFKGKRFDCGSVEGYIDAINYCYDNVYLKDDKAELDKAKTEKTSA